MTIDEARNPRIRIGNLDNDALRREHKRRVASWYHARSDEGAKLNTFISRLVVNELQARGELWAS